MDIVRADSRVVSNGCVAIILKNYKVRTKFAVLKPTYRGQGILLCSPTILLQFELHESCGSRNHCSNDDAILCEVTRRIIQESVPLEKAV